MQSLGLLFFKFWVYIKSLVKTAQEEYTKFTMETENNKNLPFHDQLNGNV